ncbi:MAG: ABC transporter permease [Planctomycetia bacterium]|nr:ABC transporter permease [Planctomycetia bacterium]
MVVQIRTAERPPRWQDALPWRMRLWHRRNLIQQLIRREVVGRYRGSLLGTLWAVCLPLFAVAVYTLVFGLILKQRWPGREGIEFPLLVWTGLAVFNTLAEILQRAPSVILAQPNLVKKVVFPLEVLPVMLVGTSLVPLGISLSAVGVGAVWITGELPHVPVLIINLFLLMLFLQGTAWLLAGIGTFLRDLQPMMQALCPLLLFLSPILYPLDVVPTAWQTLFWLNPLTVLVEGMRSALLHTASPPLWAWVLCLVNCLIAWNLGSFVFTRTRPDMADVV